MATINYILQGDAKPSKIFIRFKDGRNIDLKAKTNYSINPENWSKAKGQPKNLKEASLKRLNEDLNNLKTNLLNHFNKLVATEGIDIKWLKNFLNPKKDKSETAVPEKLISYIDYYLLHKKSSLRLNSYKK